MRQNAANWLELAEKVWRFRRDRLDAAETAALTARRERLKALLKAGADPADLKLAIEELEGVLRRVGGAIYPKTSLTENVEFFLVAAIVILGIRSYFVQPFKIPTNSMWPTYYGMTAVNLPPGEPAPGPAARLARLLLLGARRREAVAPHDGAVSAAFFANRRMAYTVKAGRTWLVIPTRVKEYTFYVDGDPVPIRVPQDFNDFDGVVIQTFFGDEGAFDRYWNRAFASESLRERDVPLDEGSGNTVRAVVLPLPKAARAGEPILRFDLLTGDQLFVDRLSYHFVRPEVGQGFVFRTGHIEAIGQDQYYIKRLIGAPGDVIEVKAPALYRNGAPITGAEAFDLNARRVPPYGGYTYADSIYGGRHLFKGESLTVAPRCFFAMGDNSANSADGRVWGFVPEKDVVGRPLFIYYPFSRRWGPAR